MIASLRGVMVACALALALVLVALVDGLRPRPSTDRALVPGFTAVTSLAWPTFAIARVGAHWTADGGPLDDDAVDVVISTLRGARWHRRAEAARAGAITTTLRAGPTTIRIGEPLAGTAQQWVAIDDAAYLVDAWVARALAPARWQLRDRAPWRDLADGLNGSPRWLDPDRLRDLIAALAQLTIIGPADAPTAPPPPPLAIGAHAITPRGTCAGGVALPEGCVATAAWEAVVAAVARLAVDPRPSPIAPATVDLAGGTVALAAADPDAVAELVAIMRTPAELVDVSIPSAHTTVTVRDPKGTAIVLELHPPDLVVRTGDAALLRVGTGAFAILARPAAAYADRVVWREEPSTITRLVYDGVAYERGVVIGEWRRAGGPSTPAPRIEQLVGALASPRAEATAPPAGFAVVHRGAIDVVAVGSSTPITSQITHVFELGGVTPAGCPMRTGGRDVLVAPAVCAS
ncbi:MAG: hypothetical protein NT062_00985, partial [Proteobacteria bacterium]|nr:hypothetical protein [Pseudomonadota bacterium]